jgi:hypothetical protein
VFRLLPQNNIVSENMFSDYGIWTKQSAAFHKALAPGNAFVKNVVWNCSRHGVNFQDSMGGDGLVAQNVFFNVRRGSDSLHACIAIPSR